MSRVTQKGATSVQLSSHTNGRRCALSLPGIHDFARQQSSVLVQSRFGSIRLGSARLGSARLGSARLGSARLGSARLGSARLGSTRLGSTRLGSARLGSARLGSTRLDWTRLGSAWSRVGYDLTVTWPRYAISSPSTRQGYVMFRGYGVASQVYTYLTHVKHGKQERSQEPP